MNPETMLVGLLESLRSHLQLPGQAWVPLAASGSVLLLGLLLLLRGARWARGLSGIAFLGIGAAAAAPAATATGLPVWPVVGIGAVLGLMLGLLLLRVWQTLLLAATFVAIGIGVYGARDLKPHIDTWLEPQVNGEVTLAPAGTVVGEQAADSWARVGELWGYLGTHVPHFQLTFWSLVGLTGLAGLIFGWLLPRATKALWAATFGVLLLGMGITGLMSQWAPAQLAWLKANPSWGLGLVAAVWLAGVAYNLRFSGDRKRASMSNNDGEAGPAAQPATVA